MQIARASVVVAAVLVWSILASACGGSDSASRKPLPSVIERSQGEAAAPSATASPSSASSPSVPPSPTAVPSSPPPAAPTPVSGTVDLTGKVPSDFPGLLLAPSTTVTSIVDPTSKRYDVYAINLDAGKALRIHMDNLSPDESDLRISYSYPTPKSFRDLCVLDTRATSPKSCAIDNVAVGGVYYLQIATDYSNTKYTITVSVE